MTKKDSKLQDTIKRYIPTLIASILIVSVIFMIYSVYLFSIGFHNIDVGQNIRYLNAEFGLDLIDITNQNINMQGIELYQIGIKQMKSGFILLFISTLLFSSSFCDVFYMIKKNKQNFLK